MADENVFERFTSDGRSKNKKKNDIKMPKGIGKIIVEVGTQLVVTILSGGVLLNTLSTANLNKFSNGFVILIDRIVSSLVYGLALSVLLISQSPIAFPGWVSVPSVIVFAVVAFVVDLTYIRKKL